jgi:AmmeMemoRadiSam system protein A
VRASFVTLNIADRLRGCIGRLEATRPLVEDLADNAFSAAFRDPRFPPLSALEYTQIALHVSILSPATELEFNDQADLVRRIRPGIDGLILIEGSHRGTFLPSVWESLPEPREFIAQLKVKAGLPADYWSDRIKVLRYTTESFGRA